MEIEYNLKDLAKVANDLVQKVTSKTLLFYGEMGTGKTTMVKAIVKNLGSTDVVSSPTFSLVNEYHTNKGDIIYHFDLYRVNDIEEVYNIGIEDYLYSGHWVIIEWPELIEELLPNDVNSIHIQQNVDETRALKLKFELNLT